MYTRSKNNGTVIKHLIFFLLCFGTLLQESRYIDRYKLLINKNDYKLFIYNQYVYVPRQERKRESRNDSYTSGAKMMIRSCAHNLFNTKWYIYDLRF